MLVAAPIRRLAPVLLMVVLPARLAAQAPKFTLDDVLEVRGVSVGDVTDDGRWAVITTTSLRDRLGADQSRFGDPTYLAPAVAEISLVDTRTGEARKLFPDKRQARAFAWSPDGSLLAFLLRDGDGFRLVLWERERGRLRTVTLPQGRVVADNAPLQWSADGSLLLFSMRAAEWQAAARNRFLKETQAPIVVQSSDDPFLSWEEIRSLSSRQIPAVYHLPGGRVQELLPETSLGAVALSADGQSLRYEEDITTKTDYTQIFGRERKLVVRPVAGGEAKTLLPSLKDVRLVWSGDGQRYAYAKEGKVYLGSLGGGEPKQLAGVDPPKPGEEPADSAARTAARDALEKERFTPVRLSEAGDRLVATNKEGFWLFDTQAGERRMFLAAPADSNDRFSPRYEVVAWSEDGDDIYLTYASRTAWERGVVRYNLTRGERQDLVKDGRLYSGIELSADGGTMVMSIAEGNRPGTCSRRRAISRTYGGSPTPTPALAPSSVEPS